MKKRDPLKLLRQASHEVAVAERILKSARQHMTEAMTMLRAGVLPKPCAPTALPRRREESHS